MVAGMIDKMGVMHPGRAGRHAGKTGEAPIEMRHLDRPGRSIRFEHVFDQINTPSRRIALVTQQMICRACRRTKTAMNAGTQNGVGLLNLWIGQLGKTEMGLHDLPHNRRYWIKPPWIEEPVRVEGTLDPGDQASHGISRLIKGTLLQTHGRRGAKQDRRPA